MRRRLIRLLVPGLLWCAIASRPAAAQEVSAAQLKAAFLANFAKFTEWPPEAAAGQTLDFTVEDTGHFQNFVEKTAGTIMIGKAGDYALEIRAVRKAKGAVMDVRQVRLDPAP